MYPVSACVFIRNTFEGAFCVFESMASIMPFVDEFIVMDLGSNDGTWKHLASIARHNKKVKLLRGTFTKIDANVFATLANDLIAMCKNENVLYYQADEIWHENLLSLMAKEFELGNFDLSFWRIQYKNNFQHVKWFPHIVHRVGKKNNFNFIEDGMNTDRTWDAKIVGNYDGSWFPRWGAEFESKPTELPTNEMITDISLIGAFRDNVVQRRALHVPFWHEEMTIEDMDARKWYQQACANPEWTRDTSPFDLPQILHYHIGRLKYELRPELYQSLKNGVVFK